ncbi:hypothetical protein ACFU6I_45425, partial [Streptomyces sp. NPDC057486]|uniref:hypothetical protein n=1 Tax=Streptomyces sp. NPDC057486 TaxID=3346145 RepID=UPI0036B632D6
MMHTDDAAYAFRVAERLFGLAETLQFAEVSLWARLYTAEEVQRVRYVLPAGAWFESGDYPETKSFQPHQLPVGSRDMAELLPLSLGLEEDVLFGSFEGEFAAVVGTVPAALHWYLGAWPATPS